MGLEGGKGGLELLPAFLTSGGEEKGNISVFVQRRKAKPPTAQIEPNVAHGVQGGRSPKKEGGKP